MSEKAGIESHNLFINKLVLSVNNSPSYKKKGKDSKMKDYNNSAFNLKN